MWYLSATEIPPAGAPPGGRGSLCGVVWLCRSPLNPVCRYDEVICSEMTQRVAGEWEEKQNAVFVRTVKRRIIPVACTIYHTKHIWYHAPVPPRVILSEAAPLTKNHAHPPTIAAQSNPAPSGAPAGGISIAERHHITPRTTPKSPPPVGGRKIARSLARQCRMRAKQASADA